MSTKIRIDHHEAHEKLTARMFWKRTSESGYNDAGNIREYADASTRSLVTRATSQDGFRQVNDEQVDVNHQAWTFLLDERDPANEKLLSIGKSLTDETQSFSEGATATITSAKQGKWHAIGAYNIANVAVSGATSGALVEGTDYNVDTNNGRVFFIEDAGLSDGDTVTVTFDRPALTIEKFQSQDNPLFYCDFILEEFNQHSKMWLRRHTFKGYLNVTEFPNQTGEFGTFRVKVTASAAVTTQKRAEGQTLSEATETTEAAGMSSSSSNSSSSSS